MPYPIRVLPADPIFFQGIINLFISHPNRIAHKYIRGGYVIILV
jgi:hypothetical protein